MQCENMFYKIYKKPTPWKNTFLKIFMTMNFLVFVKRFFELSMFGILNTYIDDFIHILMTLCFWNEYWYESFYTFVNSIKQRDCLDHSNFSRNAKTCFTKFIKKPTPWQNTFLEIFMTMNFLVFVKRFFELSMFGILNRYTDDFINILMTLCFWNEYWYESFDTFVHSMQQRDCLDCSNFSRNAKTCFTKFIKKPTPWKKLFWKFSSRWIFWFL